MESDHSKFSLNDKSKMAVLGTEHGMVFRYREYRAYSNVINLRFDFTCQEATWFTLEWYIQDLELHRWKLPSYIVRVHAHCRYIT